MLLSTSGATSISFNSVRMRRKFIEKKKGSIKSFGSKRYAPTAGVARRNGFFWPGLVLLSGRIVRCWRSPGVMCRRDIGETCRNCAPLSKVAPGNRKGVRREIWGISKESGCIRRRSLHKIVPIGRFCWSYESCEFPPFALA